MLVAIEGCGHGELDKIYGSIRDAEQREGIKVDLLLCCGDFQAVRNRADLNTMACPPKYRSMNTFYKYYSGEAVAPVLTLFVGGNHEASSHSWELPYGGWVAPNIYYLGFASVVNVGGLRIAGMSGIYKSHDYHKGHHESMPFNESEIRSFYHTRSFDAFLLRQLRQPMDVFLSHDWPQGIVEFGDKQHLLRTKRGLAGDIHSGQLGSKPGREVLQAMKPSYWFAAHLHTKFAALVPHPDNTATRFLALDKCLPRRHFMQFMEFPEATGPPVLKYDLEWLAVLKSTAHLRPTTQANWSPPRAGRVDFSATEEELGWVKARAAECLKTEDPVVPLNFVKTVPPHGDNTPAPPPKFNPQTVALCQLLGIEDPCAARPRPPQPQLGHGFGAGPPAMLGTGGLGPCPPVPGMLPTTAQLPGPPTAVPDANPDEIDLDDDDDDDKLDGEAVHNADEIDLDAVSDGDDDDDADDVIVGPVARGVAAGDNEALRPDVAEVTVEQAIHATAQLAQTATPATSDGTEIVFKRRNEAIYAAEPDED